jgi:hypothetical protein
MHDPPIACSLEQHLLRERLARWQTLRTCAGVSTTPTEHGLRLAFRARVGVEAELRALVALERDCCTFAEWSIRSDGERVLLDVTGAGEEAVAAVQGMFRGREPAPR